jgi:hypothetical protein
MRLGIGHASSFADSETRREEARAVFEESADDYGLGRYWWSVAMESWFRMRALETADACERALAHLARAGERGARLRGRVRSSWAPAITAARCPSTRHWNASGRCGRASTASFQKRG